MSLSAVFLGGLGILTSFMPQETLRHFGTTPAGPAVLLVQAGGALYLGFAILNWTARAIMIGGIYARPVALGNFLHFAVATLAGWKWIAAAAAKPTEAVILCVADSVFALWFGAVLFGSHAEGLNHYFCPNR